MAKFWRSGMIDKKVVREREQAEYINKLERTILELSREEPDVGDLINGIDYDEVRKGDNVILDFGEDFIIATPRERLKDSMFNAYSRWLRNRGPYDINLKFEKQAFGENKNENNTRTL